MRDRRILPGFYISGRINILGDMRMVRFLIGFLGVWLCLGLPGAQAQDTPQPDKYVKIRLLPERNTVAPGEEFWVGVEQSIYPGWHTYWRNPGDSGSDPRVRWTLPAGFEIGEIQWPIPHKLPFGPMTNYGYEDNVILLQKLKAPSSLPEGPLNFSAEIEILVCEEICIPEFGTYTMTLNPPPTDEMAEDNAAYLLEAAAKLPAQAPEEGVLRKTADGKAELEIPSAAWCNHGEKPCSDLEMFPLEWGVVNNTAAPEILFDGQSLSIRQQAGERDWAELESPKVLVTYTNAQGIRSGMEFAAALEMPGAASGDSAGFGQAGFSGAEEASLPFILLLALAGGLVLNLMPCVFPVLSLKALSLVKIAQKDPGAAKMHGIAYTGGIILSFLAIAGILIALQSGGSAVGWGFQLQNPVVIVLLIYLLFGLGLNLMGFFEMAGSFTSAGGRLTQGEGLSASFFTGVLATLVATPCTAPFMGTAIGFALTQTAFISLTVFAVLGLGLALPYLILSFLPALQRFLPRPGAWMETFRQFLAFPIFLTCAWLIWVLAEQTGSMGVLGGVLGIIALTFTIWLWKNQPERGAWRVIVLILAALSALLAFGFLPISRESGPSVSLNAATEKFGEVYSAAILEDALKTPAPVFVEMTAAWCITCKVNHATSINIDSTKALFTEKGIKFLVGDWTKYDPAITEYLERFGRRGVPLYVYYAPPDSASGQRPEPVILPQILTPGIVADAIKP